jgi:UDP-glucose 4-epimerase
LNTYRPDIPLLERVLGEFEIDTVIHLAAQTIVGIANRNPVSTFETNIQGTCAVLEACRRSPKVKQIVLASSDKAYGDQEKLPYDESTPLQGRHPYDVSKSCADLIGQTYAHTYLDHYVATMVERIKPLAAREHGVVRAGESGLGIIIGKSDRADVHPHRVIREPASFDALVASQVIRCIA